MVLFVGLAEDEDALCILRIDGEQLFALRTMAVEDDESVAQGSVLYLRHETFAHFFGVLFGEYHHGVLALRALADDGIHEHIIGAEKEHMVMEDIAQLSTAVGGGAVLDDVAQDGDEHTRHEYQTKEVDDDLEDDMRMSAAHELARSQDELDDLADGETEPASRTDAPEDQYQKTDHEYHPEYLPALPLTEHPVYAIEKTIHTIPILCFNTGSR